MRRSAEEPENEKDDFQEAFRHSLYSYRAPVDPQGWSRLEETLNNDSQEKRRGFITWLAAACAGLLLLSGSIIGYLNLQKTNPEIALETVGKSVEKVTVPTSKGTVNSIASAKVKSQKQITSSEEIAFVKAGKKTRIASNKYQTFGDEESTRLGATLQQDAIASAFKNSLNTNNTSATGKVAFEQTKSYPSPKIATGSNDEGLYVPAEYSAGSVVSYTAGMATDDTREISSKANEVNVAHASARQNHTISYGKSSTEESLALSEIDPSESKSNTKDAETEQLTIAKTNNTTLQSLGETIETGAVEKKSKDFNAENGNLAIASAEDQSPDTTKAALPKQNTLLVQDEIATKVQENEARANTVSKWQVALAYGGLNFQQNLQVNGFGEMSGDIAPQTINDRQNYRFEAEREFNETTRSAYSWQSSVSVGYDLNPHLTVLSGLQFSDFNAQTLTHYFLHKIPTYPMMNVPNQSSMENEYPILQTVFQSPAFPDSVVEKTRAGMLVNYQYRYVGVPLDLEYHTAFKSKWNIFVKGGMAINRLIKASFSAEQPNAKHESQFKGTDDPFRNWQITVNSATGISYKLDPHWQLKAGMEGNVFLQGLAKQNQYLNSGLPYSYGLNTSLTYQF